MYFLLKTFPKLCELCRLFIFVTISHALSACLDGSKFITVITLIYLQCVGFDTTHPQGWAFCSRH